MMLHCLQPLCKNPTSILGSISSTFMHGFITKPFNETRQHKYGERTKKLCRKRGRTIIANGFVLPMDVDSESTASQLFALSLLPYLGFLYFITKSKSAPKLTLFGFYFLLAFVGATANSINLIPVLILSLLVVLHHRCYAVPASIYAKVHYGTCLSNVDWLHDGAESLLILTNIFIVLGLRGAIRDAKYIKERTSNPALGIKDADKPST